MAQARGRQPPVLLLHYTSAGREAARGATHEGTTHQRTTRSSNSTATTGNYDHLQSRSECMASTTNTMNTNSTKSTNTGSETNASATARRTNTINTQHATKDTGAPVSGATGKTTRDSTLLASRDVKDFTLAPPMVDVRGWNVLSGGVKIGRVDRIMLDAREQKPRYLAVTPSDRKGHMLLPIGVGTLDRDRKQVLVQHLTPEMLKTLPMLTSDAVTRDFERSIFGAVKGAKITDQTLPQIYTDPMYDASRLFGSRVAPAGT
ncbi:MAG: PRC-barrel domain-containing protein [Gemmatimonadota bacterium]